MLHPMLLEAGLLRVPKILVLLFALCRCWFCFVAVVFLLLLLVFFVFSVLVQDLHPPEIGDMLLSSPLQLSVVLAPSPPAAGGHAHPPLCHRGGKEKAVRKPRGTATRSAAQPAQTDAASPGRAGPARAGPRPLPTGGRAAGTPRPLPPRGGDREGGGTPPLLPGPGLPTRPPPKKKTKTPSGR